MNEHLKQTNKRWEFIIRLIFLFLTSFEYYKSTEYSMMKTNISNKNPFQKRKNVAKGADRPSMLYNTIKSAISSVG